MKKYNFDKHVDRFNTDCLKWDGMGLYYNGRTDLIPMWVADMDFQVADEIKEALVNKANHAVFGYGLKKADYYNAIIGWFDRRHNLELKREWMMYMPTVVSAIHGAITKFSNQGDNIAIMSPVYGPFSKAIKTLKRNVVESPLKQVGDTFEIDFENLESVLKDSKILLFCSPHNPVGRVWKIEELEKVAELCAKYKVLLISDEIHCDLVMSGHKHIPMLNVSEEAKNNTILLVSASKTFNLAGLMACTVIIPNKDILTKFAEFIFEVSLGMTNCFTIAGVKAAYEKGDVWVNEVVEYIEGNYNYTRQFIIDNIPEITPIQLQGTYLMWLDCKKISCDDNDLIEIFQNQGKVAGENGGQFGEVAQGFYRLNLATQRSVIEKTMEQMLEAVKSWRNK